MTTRESVMPMDEMRRRYAALGVIEEMMGERSYLGCCSTFEWFLVYGPLLADDLRAGYELPAVRDHLPGLGCVVVGGLAGVKTASNEWSRIVIG
jgi:hypothetical protein